MYAAVSRRHPWGGSPTKTHSPRRSLSMLAASLQSLQRYNTQVETKTILINRNQCLPLPTPSLPFPPIPLEQTLPNMSDSTSQPQRQLHNPPTIHPPAPSYTHISTVPLSPSTKLITIAGQIGMDPSGKIPPSFAAQVQLALANLSTCLASAGCTTEDIVKCGMYIVGKPGGDEEMDDVRRKAYKEFLGEARPPPDTLIYVAALADQGLLFEIDCMAVGKL